MSTILVAAMLDDISDNAAVWLGLTSPISRGLLKAAAVVFAVKSSFRLVDHISRITADPDSERAIRAHIDTVKQKYAYMAGHVDQEYFSDQGLALKIPRGAVIVDVGAHFGLFSMQCFAKSGFTSKHFCFEPIPKIRDVCNSTMEGLDPNGNKIKVFPFGLSDKAGVVDFTYVAAAPELSGYKDVAFEREVNLATDTQVERYYDPNCPAYFRKILPPWFWYLPRFVGEPLLRKIYNKVMASRPDTELVRCELRCLSNVLAEHEVGSTIDVLKIDVEGAELDVLRGISSSDWCKVQVAVIEVHDKDGNLALVRKILTENGLVNIVEEQDLITKPLMIWQIIAKRN